ncbi:hypothetical protein [Vibrio hepatarius]|uniref:hypothetical protein n=1 Tax=Vibrio hepatarius TaxID=171383 RepID=UPI001C09BE00|nr:hypothetical protein [Vibrio hepatarius]MBU2895648.1 hypothetical protein [Vibrio hepatarius]
MSNKLPVFKLKVRDLAFDKDDVLVQFAQSICSLMNEVGDHAEVSDYATYFFGSYHNVSYEKFRSLIEENEVFKHVEEFEGAIDVLHALVIKGFRIHVVTARGGFENSEELTADWLERKRAPVDSLTVMGKEKNYSKSFYYNEINDGVAIIVDDASHNIIDAVENAPSVIPFIVTRPWNENDEQINNLIEEGKVYRISSVVELVDCLELSPELLEEAA